MTEAQTLLHYLLLPLLLLLATSFTSNGQETAKKINGIDLAALASIRDSLTDIPGSSFFSTWDFTSPDPCSTFAGVTCSPDDNNPRVTILTLGTALSGFPGLSGSLSPSLANLTQLTQLILYPGLVTGPIPPQLGQLRNLRVLSLTNNRLTGPIPTSLASSRSLHTLDLSRNRLSGSIPAGLFSGSGMPELKVVILASNILSGELPRSVSTPLLHLDLKRNKLSGQLPLTLPSSLRYLSVSDNAMWGPLNGLRTLPEESDSSSTTSLLGLGFLDLSMNRFSGPIPGNLFRPSLSFLFLQRNNLSGGLPPLPLVPPDPNSSSLSYGEGSIVDLSHNSLSGKLSTALAGVESLFLNNNRLVGRVPQEYADSLYRGTTRTLYLQHNYITDFPLEPSLALPDTASLCLSYNCMDPTPVGLSACPASAGPLLSRPLSQCLALHDANSTH